MVCLTGVPLMLVSAVTATIALADVRTMDDVMSISAAERRLTMLMLSAFAGLALLLAAVGIYGAHREEALTEDSPVGSDFLASVCTAWEAAAMAAAYNTTFRRPLRTPERTVVEKSVEVLKRLRAASTLNSQRDVYRQASYLGRQFGAALATTGCQDGTAGTGTHTKAEAVLLGSTAVIRLKSPLAHVSYSSGSKVRPPDQ